MGHALKRCGSMQRCLSTGISACKNLRFFSEPRHPMPMPTTAGTRAAALLFACTAAPLRAEEPLAHSDAHSRCPGSPFIKTLGVCRCRCVLVDVGLNAAKRMTLLSWAPQILRHGTRSWRVPPGPKKDAMAACVRHNTTCYLGFEGNPLFADELDAAAAALRRSAQTPLVHIYTTTVLGAEDSEAMPFLIDPKVSSAFRGIGSSLDADKSTAYLVDGAKGGKRSHWEWNKSLPVGEAYTTTPVKSIGAARFFGSLLSHSVRCGVSNPQSLSALQPCD